ncbi:pyroglutamyl-peptidase I [Canibacter zhoujuaniae]|uniref:pyroglutamyl-peptidase I n=1 Tax=Canibacter zhoujuaniae TaxID=2708343 RepID=UPI0014238A54|nr:pyroglutamyl-peptidase I [Canibacter zhoujuaniae]
MRILVTGFDPFDGEEINPAREAVFALPDEIAGAAIIKAEVPTEFMQSTILMRELIAQHSPDIVLCVGQAGGISGLNAERVAINLQDARIPDNAGYAPLDAPVIADGPAAYFATLPVKAMVRAAREAGLAAQVSYSAGTFVCNHLMYVALHELRARPDVRAGFVHIPYLPEQVAKRPGVPAMPLAETVRGLSAMISAAVGFEKDLEVSEGALN